MSTEQREERPALAPESMTALVVAGASGPPSERGGHNKNFFRLRGRPVVQRQLDLAESLGFRRVVLVTDPGRVGELDLPAGGLVIPSSARQSDNFARVKEELSFADDERCLVLFGDTPLVTPGAVTDFLARCATAPAVFHHGLVPYAFAEPFMDFFPRETRGRRPFHVREFTARLGCLSLVRPSGFDPAATRRGVAAVMSGRKQDPTRGGLPAVLIARARVVWGGLRFFGPMGAWLGAAAIVSHWLHERGFPAGARFTSRPVTLARLDAVATKLMACAARLLPCPFGGASLDVDTDADLAVHEQHHEEMVALQGLQERLVAKLVEPDFDLSPECLGALERFDPEAAAEVRRHPWIYREQRRILRHFFLAAPRGATHAA